MEWFNENSYELLEWPSNSPDLNSEFFFFFFNYFFLIFFSHMLSYRKYLGLNKITSKELEY